MFILNLKQNYHEFYDYTIGKNYFYQDFTYYVCKRNSFKYLYKNKYINQLCFWAIGVSPLTFYSFSFVPLTSVQTFHSVPLIADICHQMH